MNKFASKILVAAPIIPHSGNFGSGSQVTGVGKLGDLREVWHYLAMSFAVSLAVIAGIMVWLTSGDEPKDTPITSRPAEIRQAQHVPSVTDDNFLAALTANGADLTQTDMATHNAHVVCESLQAGVARSTIVDQIQTASHGFSHGDAWEFVALSIQYYCPQSG
jgi:hypothetical protein